VAVRRAQRLTTEGRRLTSRRPRNAITQQQRKRKKRARERKVNDCEHNVHNDYMQQRNNKTPAIHSNLLKFISTATSSCSILGMSHPIHKHLLLLQRFVQSQYMDDLNCLAVMGLAFRACVSPPPPAALPSGLIDVRLGDLDIEPPDSFLVLLS